jgi:hypothetical protein
MEKQRAAMIDARERGAKDRTGPSMRLILGAEGIRNFQQKYPKKTEAFLVAAAKLSRKEMTSLDRLKRDSIGRFAYEMTRLMGSSHDAHVAALILPIIGRRSSEDPQQDALLVRNSLRGFLKKNGSTASL